MFDSVASEYDTAFTDTPLARALRAQVWQRLDRLFPPGARVLELACGTGEDARYLASRGVRLLATDQSDGMLAAARAKCAGLPVEFARLDLSEERLEIGDWGVFDGAFSNFGGLNTLPGYGPLGAQLRSLVRPGGRLLFVVMGRWCAWEIAWHLAHGQPRAAFRRLGRGGAPARVGAGTIQVYYPSLAALRRAFAPHFRLERVRPLGVFLPPSYLEPLTRQPWFPFRLFAWLDRRVSFPPWGDHLMAEWRAL